MALTEEQREIRRSHIGASDAPAIMGQDHFRTGQDVFAEKVYGTDDDSNEAMEMGNWLEGPLLEYAAEQLELGDDITMGFTRGTHHVHPNGILACNLDGEIDAKRAMEAKYTGQVDDWGDPWTDQVPPHVLIQTAVQFGVIETLETVYVPVFLAGFRAERAIYQVDRNPDLVKATIEACMEFHQHFIVPKIQPPAEYGLPSLETYKRVRREQGKTVDIPSAPVEIWLELRERLKTTEKEKEQAQANVIASMGDAEVGECDLGNFTFKKQTRKPSTTKGSTFRVLRFSKNK